MNNNNLRIIEGVEEKLFEMTFNSCYFGGI